EVALAEPAAETGGVPPAADPDSVADSVAADEIASASEPPVAASTPAVLAESASPGGGVASAAPALSLSVAPLPQAIVRVGLKREALANNAFEQVLKSSGIAVEAPETSEAVVSQLAAVGYELEEQATRARGLAELSRREGRRIEKAVRENGERDNLDGDAFAAGAGSFGAGLAGRFSDASSEPPAGTAAAPADKTPIDMSSAKGAVVESLVIDAVLVDAEPQAIEECLNRLNLDVQNFRSVAVEPTPAPSDADAFLEQQQQVLPLQRFSRSVSGASIAMRRVAPAPPLAGERSSFSQAMPRGGARAYRVQPLSQDAAAADTESLRGRGGAGAESASGVLPPESRRPADGDAAATSRLQLLFLLESEAGKRPSD
ncbi:MAG: hypothetical protein AAGG46_10785, partial [Planctomycetota bacterium]